MFVRLLEKAVAPTEQSPIIPPSKVPKLQRLRVDKSLPSSAKETDIISNDQIPLVDTQIVYLWHLNM